MTNTQHCIITYMSCTVLQYWYIVTASTCNTMSSVSSYRYHWKTFISLKYKHACIDSLVAEANVLTKYEPSFPIKTRWLPVRLSAYSDDCGLPITAYTYCFQKTRTPLHFCYNFSLCGTISIKVTLNC